MDYITIPMEKIISLQLPAGSELAPLDSHQNITAVTTAEKPEFQHSSVHQEINTAHNIGVVYGIGIAMAVAGVAMAYVDRGRHHRSQTINE